MRFGGNDMKYQQSLVVFMDILGFKEYVLKECEELDGIYSIFEFAKKIQYLYDTSELHGVKIGFFSDSFVLTTTDISKSGFMSLMIACHMINICLFKGIHLCSRGAVTIGRVYHHEGIVFGPGVVKAYEMERDKAKFVRMLVDEEVVQVVNNFVLTPKTEDGYYELNWFMIAIQDGVKSGEYQHEKSIELAKRYRGYLLELIEEYKSTRIYEKYKSLVELFNKFCCNMAISSRDNSYIELAIKEDEC